MTLADNTAYYNSGYSTGKATLSGRVFYCSSIAEDGSVSYTLDKDYNEIYVINYRKSTAIVGTGGSINTNCTSTLFWNDYSGTNYGHVKTEVFKLTNCKKGNYFTFNLTKEGNGTSRILYDVLIIIGY